MKKIKILIVLIVALVGFNSCEKDELVFTAQEPGEFSFTNSFLDEYVLTSNTTGNIGERFTWNSANFDVPTAVAYDLQSSLTEDFAEVNVVGSTSNNDIAVTIGQLLSMANALGLDGDPDSEAPNTGQVYFRLRAYIANNTLESFSIPQAMTLVISEETGGGGSSIMPSDWGVVGSGYNNWGAFTDGAFYTTSTADEIVSYVTLVDGEIKFRLNNDWGTNYGDDGGDGTLEADGANIPVTAGTYKITVNTANNTYTIVPFSFGIVGSGYNDWGAAGPDAKVYYDYTSDTWKVGVKLLDGEVKIRLNNDWGTNYGDTGGDGTLDQDGDNIPVTAGYYLLTVDLNNLTYTLESADVWGVVGSGYNNWGATPDFSLTQLNADTVVGDIVTLIDGEVKFRVNNDWGLNYGDSGADGTLDQDGDNIAVTAGQYRVAINLLDNTYSLNKIQ